MHLTRTGFNAIVALYLLPLVIVDFFGNTFATGVESDYFYYKTIFDGLLFVYACWQMFREPTAHVNTAQARTNNTTGGDADIIGFENLGAIEYIYCAALCLYALVNWYFLHTVNKTSTGMMSIATLVWSIMSIMIAVLAAVQFYHLKSGTIVELKKRVIQ